MLETKGTVLPSCDEIINEIGACETNYDLFRILRLICLENQCKYFMVSEIPKEEEFKLQEALIVSNWDPELIREFDLEYKETFNELFQSLKVSINPISLTLPIGMEDTSQTSDTGKNTETLSECIFFPAYDRVGRKGMIGFSIIPADYEHRFEKLGFLSSFVFDKFMEIKKATTTQNNALSEREIQCLNWTALGKTSYEIGIILDISLNTVNHYLNNASRKLNCVNRTHAVAKCVQEGIIEF
ncbi:MAG: helix-turn-helix transcriptional regulator [Pseudomonadota bacterium]